MDILLPYIVYKDRVLTLACKTFMFPIFLKTLQTRVSHADVSVGHDGVSLYVCRYLHTRVEAFLL
jgi:hypothetical protein